MAEAYTLEEAKRRLSEKATKTGILIGNATTFATLANEARSRGDHGLAKKHLRKALDYEFEALADNPCFGPLAEAWYNGEEI